MEEQTWRHSKEGADIELYFSAYIVETWGLLIQVQLWLPKLSSSENPAIAALTMKSLFCDLKKPIKRFNPGECSAGQLPKFLRK